PVAGIGLEPDFQHHEAASDIVGDSGEVVFVGKTLAEAVVSLQDGAGTCESFLCEQSGKNPGAGGIRGAQSSAHVASAVAAGIDAGGLHAGEAEGARELVC